MSPEEMTHLLVNSVPLCEFMQITTVALSGESITTTAPLEPNINRHGTGFAGSLYSLAVATGWALIWNRVSLSSADGDLVLRHAEIRYQEPVNSDLRIQSSLSNLEPGEDFLLPLQQGKKIAIPLEISVLDNRKICALVDAEYVLLPKSG